MATRKRDYKAEYRAAQQRARNAGYTSEREYRSARKRLGTPRRASPLPKPVYEQVVSLGRHRDTSARAWSKKHSRVVESKWRDDFTEDEREAYYNAFVQRPASRKEWRRNLKDILVPRHMTADEYDDRYGSGYVVRAIA